MPDNHKRSDGTGIPDNLMMDPSRTEPVLKDRFCPKCGTKLSRWNKSEWCFIHEGRGYNHEVKPRKYAKRASKQS